MNVTPTKINLYKFVSTTGIAAASDAKKQEKATIGIQTKQVEAINQLGGVVNGIAASLVKIEAIEIARAKALAIKLLIALNTPYIILNVFIIVF